MPQETEHYVRLIFPPPKESGRRKPFVEHTREEIARCIDHLLRAIMWTTSDNSLRPKTTMRNSAQLALTLHRAPAVAQPIITVSEGTCALLRDLIGRVVYGSWEEASLEEFNTQSSPRRKRAG